MKMWTPTWYRFRNLCDFSTVLLPGDCTVSEFIDAAGATGCVVVVRGRVIADCVANRNITSSNPLSVVIGPLSSVDSEYESGVYDLGGLHYVTETTSGTLLRQWNRPPGGDSAAGAGVASLAVALPDVCYERRVVLSSS